MTIVAGESIMAVTGTGHFGDKGEKIHLSRWKKLTGNEDTHEKIGKSAQVPRRGSWLCSETGWGKSQLRGGNDSNEKKMHEREHGRRRGKKKVHLTRVHLVGTFLKGSSVVCPMVSYSWHG